ncbi:MAG: hypothetical protein WBM24_25335 [Candidatus Sulfotelmatobacter sp.]
MPDLTPQQKRMMSVLKWLFRVGILSFAVLGCLSFYFGEKAPTAANTTSGEVYPFYDKFHSNYVYLTEIESKSLPVLLCVGVICIFSSIFIDLRLKRLLTSSEEERRRGEYQDESQLDK